MYFKFNQEKALASVLYVATRLVARPGKRGADLHKIFKILYFADQKHLVRYGRPVVGDVYIAMEHGPVPSTIYDLVKMARGDSICEPAPDIEKKFRVSGHYLVPVENPDMDEFSQSDLECLDESIRENQSLSFPELKIKSHDSAHKSAHKDDKISYLDIARAGGATREALSSIRLHWENERSFDR